MIERMMLDTDTVIHLLRHSPLTVQPFIQLYHNGTIFLVSPIVIAEVYAGALVKEYESIDDFFQLCEFAPLTLTIAKQAGHYAKQYRKAYNKISLEDYLIAATARMNHCPLWTYNMKHFPMEDIELFKISEPKE